MFVEQFSLASFSAVASHAGSLIHSLISFQPHQATSCSLNVIFCFWTFAHAEPLDSIVSNSGTRMSTRPPADQPKQKLLAQATLPSIYLGRFPPQSSIFPSSNYASLHKAFPDVPSQAKGALSCTPPAPCTYTHHNSALVELSNRPSPSRTSALALSCISLGRCSRQLMIG